MPHSHKQSRRRFLRTAAGVLVPTPFVIGQSLRNPAFVARLGGAWSFANVAGLTLWLEADSGVYVDAGSTLCANAETVYQWNDKSGLGNHIVQATSGARPTYNTGKQNGLPGVTFTNAHYLDVAWADLAQSNTVFVAGMTSSRTQIEPFFSCPTAGKTQQMYYSNGTEKLTISAGTTSAYADITASQYYVWSAKFNGASSNLTTNGVAGVAAAGGSNVSSGFRLGSNQALANFLRGTILAVAVVHNCSDSDATGINSYLIAKYAIS